MDTPMRSSPYQQNKIMLNTKDNVPVIRSKLDRTYAAAPPPPRQQDMNRPTSSSNKLNTSSIQNIVVDPDTESTTPRLTMSKNEPKQPDRNAVNELSRRTANLQVQTTSSSNPLSEPNYSPKPESEQSKVHRCVSPISDSISLRVKANEYESSIKSCKPAMYRFFMEQHTEKLIQQYTERNIRSMQVSSF